MSAENASDSSAACLGLKQAKEIAAKLQNIMTNGRSERISRSVSFPTTPSSSHARREHIIYI